jgi:hypothetical protein
LTTKPIKDINHPMIPFVRLLLTLLLVCGTPLTVFGESYNYIDISNPFLRKTPIAVPLFQASGSDAEGHVCGKET